MHPTVTPSVGQAKTPAHADTATYAPVATFLSLRRWIGYAGVALPFVVALYDGGIRTSVSFYYYTESRNWFVGILFAIGTFLCSYFGHDRTDRVMSTIAGICAFGVALFPTDEMRRTVVGSVHYVFAGSLFLILAWFCIFQFTKSSAGFPGRRKLVRNRIYRTCGFTILAALGLIALVKLTPLNELESVNPVFWLEVVCLLAFGASWMIKGEFILKDCNDMPRAR